MLAAIDELRERPGRLGVLLLCVLVGIVHQATRWDWFIEDSAIVFAYARNLVQGEGVVPWPGAERIEGYSDPTWVLLIAAFQALGLDGFTVAKPLAMAMGAATTVVVWRLARATLPEHDGEGALFAPVLLAINPQLAIWSASGLENGLFCLLLSLALLRTLHEARHGGWPLAALCYLALAWTRPEGILYAALGGLAFLLGVLRSGRGLRPVAIWLAVFWIPSLFLEAARLAYFAWPLPNTYYAKILSRGSYPLDWDARGWEHLRGYASRLWHGFYLPAYVLALSGTRGHRVRIALGVVAVLGLTLLWPGPTRLQRLPIWPELPDPPSAFLVARIGLLYTAGLLLPLLAVGRPGAGARTLCWYSAFIGIFFSIYANGDWMGAYRWMSLIAPVGSVLLATGLVELADAVEQRISGQRRWRAAGWMTVALGVGLLLPVSAYQTRDHVQYNRNETPAIVKRRVDYTRSIVRRTFHEGPIVNLEMDMGAHLWWAPDYVEVDMAMLVDVAMGRHWYQQRPFIQEYVFEQRQPHFAHVHGWWARHSGLRTYDAWDQRYVELPPYEDVPPFVVHRGVWMRRDLVLSTTPPARSSRRVAFEGGIVLEDLHLPARRWAPGLDGFLAAPLSAPGGIEPFSVIAFLSSDTELATWDLPVGYGLIDPAGWRGGEIFRGQHAVPVPAGLPPGVYDLGLVVLGPDGRVLPAGGVDGRLDLPSVAIVPGPDEARLAAGEIRFPAAIRLVDPADVLQHADAVVQEARALAQADDCEAGIARWHDAKRHRPRDWSWHAQAREPLARDVADCLARRSRGLPPLEAAALLRRAHWWDHHSEALQQLGGPVGQQLYREGLEARSAQDFERAFRLFDAVLGFQPWRAWARRYAEEARDHRLGLTDDVRIGLGGAVEQDEDPGQD